MHLSVNVLKTLFDDDGYGIKDSDYLSMTLELLIHVQTAGDSLW